MPKYTFYKQTQDIDEEITGTYDPIQEWTQDQKGYFLLRINPELNMLEAAFCTNDHVIRKIIRGNCASEVYMTIIRHGLVTRLEHAAYLGKELFKAEVCLKYNVPYRQEMPLKLPLEGVLKRES